MITIIIIVVATIGFAIVAAIWSQKQSEKAQAEKEERMKEEEAKKEEERQKELARRQRMYALWEAEKQAALVGDEETIKAIKENRYDGPVPEKDMHGEYMSMYPKLHIFAMVGMKYRGNIKAYEGTFRGVLVPEPTNEYDKNAIMVKCEDGKHLGYVREFDTDEVREVIGAADNHFKPYRIDGLLQNNGDDEEPYWEGTLYIQEP